MDKTYYMSRYTKLYTMFKNMLLFYKKLRSDLESIGFEVNPYDPCIANKIINGNQMTII